MRIIVKSLVYAVMFALASVIARADDLSVKPTEATLRRIHTDGFLRCGIDVEEAEYSTSDDHGNRALFDADLCRALAAAVLGKGAKVVTTNFPDDAAAMSALAGGEVDVVASLSDDFTHAAGTHIGLTRPVLWDGVGFLLAPGSSITTARQLGGKRICFLAETMVEDSVRAWFTEKHLDFVPFPFQEEGEMQAAFATGNCGALAGDRTRLAQTRVALARHGATTSLLPDTISKDPLAMAVRNDDRQWFEIANWVIEALIQSEESGISKANVAAASAHAAQDVDPLRRFLLGGSHEIGNPLGLDYGWVVREIGATGNYGEIYERDLGAGSALKLPRGDNRLSTHGGKMIALPPR